jgi:hypothetical protein
MASSGVQLSYCTMSIASLGPPTLQAGEAPSKLRFENGISKPPAEPLPECTNFTKTFNGFRSTFNSSADIEGASPKRGRAFSNQAPRNLMCIDDIEGTRAKVRDSMFLTNRHVDPLAPQYNLPSFVPEEPIIPRQLRSTMDISDIEGSCAKVYRHRQTRDNLTTTDIEGAQASWKPRHKYALMLFMHFISSSLIAAGLQGMSFGRPSSSYYGGRHSRPQERLDLQPTH